MSLEPKLRSWWFLRYWQFNKRYCKGTAYSSLDNLVWVSIIQLALRSSESAINSSLPSCSHCHGTYYIALLGIVVISVLICVPIATSTQTKLVQYKQLVIYGRIPYLNISLISWAIYRSNLKCLNTIVECVLERLRVLPYISGLLTDRVSHSHHS